MTQGFRTYCQIIILKKITLPVFLLTILIACKQNDKAIVSAAYVDSLIKNYTVSEMAKTNEGDLAFWEKRFDSLPDNYVNGPKYASALAMRFHFYGNINDLLKADSLIKQSNIANKEGEDGLLYALANFATQQHHFKESSDYAFKANKAGDNKYGGQMALFDAAFELGQYDIAGSILKTIKPDTTYPVYFRRSKYEHYKGSLDSSIVYMMKAVDKAAGNKYLEQAALSNAADLNIHKANLTEAYNLYKKSIEKDAADFHSIMGLGWIALMHDKNDSLAMRIFSFVHAHIFSPDPLLKMIQVAEYKNDSVSQKKYAEEFAAQAGKTEYGLMYDKYLIGLYTGILNDSQKAVELAKKEIESRSTPQTYAWLAWALLKNNEQEKAFAIYNQYVSGKPLEGLELYYMGKLMQSSNKGYNAQQFFKAAYDNRYDLSPLQVNDLEKNLE